MASRDDADLGSNSGVVAWLTGQPQAVGQIAIACLDIHPAPQVCTQLGRHG
jgi:hypothetical protein